MKVALDLVFDEHHADILRDARAFRTSGDLGSTLQSIVAGSLTAAEAGRMIGDLAAWDSRKLVRRTMQHQLEFERPTALDVLNELADVLLQEAGRDFGDALIALSLDTVGAASDISERVRPYLPLLERHAARLRRELESVATDERGYQFHRDHR